MTAPGEVVVARTREDLAKELARIDRRARSLALVPTMGALHAGHLTLLDRARALADCVAMSIFVNPLQFGPDEDFARYPRELERDVALAADRGVRLVFAPGGNDMYPGGPPLVRVGPGPMGESLCGAFRPGHFEGVLTVVAKLFGLLRPDVAVFGRKDLQQAALIRRMVHDLDLGVRIEVAPLVREEDGLAMSSRNRHLSPDERKQAVGLFEGLSAADRAYRSGETRREALVSIVRDVVTDRPGPELQYVEMVDAATLQPLDEATRGTVLAVAAFVGRTRLIDNVVLGADTPDPRVGPDFALAGR